MSWTSAQRRASRDEYQRLYKSPHRASFEIVNIPENIERRTVHEPCFMCGAATALCKHRRWSVSRG